MSKAERILDHVADESQVGPSDHRGHLSPVSPEHQSDQDFFDAMFDSFGSEEAPHNPDLPILSRRGTKYMVRPYHEKMAGDLSHFGTYGWAEMATQHLYKAGDIGHLVQRSHVRDYNGVPLIVSRFVENPIDVDSYSGNLDHLSGDAAKIGLMDFLTGMPDRHGLNMVLGLDETGFPKRTVAIDHGFAFQYKESDYPKYGLDHPSVYFNAHGIAPFNAWQTEPMDSALHWWKENGPFIRHEMGNQIQYITNPKVAAHIRDRFNERADALNRFAVEWQHTPDLSKFAPRGRLSNLLEVPVVRNLDIS